MGLFGRKPTATSQPTAGSAKSPVIPIPGHRQTDSSVPHSRQTEHASEAPRGADSNFCYGDDQD